MRLWPLKILSKLPDHQLLGQHRECCALRGNGWGKKHSVVNYVFEHPYWWLFEYHSKIMNEMIERKFKVDETWIYPSYRGKKIDFDDSLFTKPDFSFDDEKIYPEHDDNYLHECLKNLKRKGIEIQ